MYFYECDLQSLHSRFFFTFFFFFFTIDIIMSVNITICPVRLYICQLITFYIVIYLWVKYIRYLSVCLIKNIQCNIVRHINNKNHKMTYQNKLLKEQFSPKMLIAYLKIIIFYILCHYNSNDQVLPIFFNKMLLIILKHDTCNYDNLLFYLFQVQNRKKCCSIFK